MTAKRVARATGITRSGGIPEAPHLETACGETGGSNMAPTAAYEPISRHASTKGASFMDGIINRQLTDFNPRLLVPISTSGHHQPMVETMADRLRQLKGEMSLEQFGALAGVSATSAMKWLKGGNVKDATLKRLLSHEPFRGRGITVEWIRYGSQGLGLEEPATSGTAGLSVLAIDIARKWMRLSEDRQEWFRDLIFTMHFVEKRFPAMRKGRPKGESYTNLEAAFERDMQQLLLKF